MMAICEAEKLFSVEKCFRSLVMVVATATTFFTNAKYEQLTIYHCKVYANTVERKNNLPMHDQS